MDNKESTRPKLTRESLREALRIFEYIRPYRWQFAFGLVLLFLGSTVFLVFPKIIGKMLDVAQGKASTSLDLKQIGFWLIGILVFQGVISYLRVMMFAQVSEKGTADIRVALYQRLISLPIVSSYDRQFFVPHCRHVQRLSSWPHSSIYMPSSYN